MKLRWLAPLGVLALALVPQRVRAGGALLPGAGAISTSRAGAAVASADDGEALVLNPAGIAKSTGTVITVSAAMIQYAMEFQRRGSYDAVPGESYPYAGQPFPRVKNAARPPLGIGSLQPVPVIAFVTDLGNRIPGLHLAAGFYAPNAYPFRDMCVQRASGCEKYVFNDNPDQAPPSTRYDILTQDAAIFLPSFAVAYRVLPSLDVGARFSAGSATVKSSAELWATVGPNYEEDVKKDGTLEVDATDGFLPAFGLGVTFRPTPHIELGANYASPLDIHAKGSAKAVLGPNPGISGLTVEIRPLGDSATRCAPGGTDAGHLKACVDFQVPMSLQAGGRYKFLDEVGKDQGDIEFDVDWQNWGKSCSDGDALSGQCNSAGTYRVVIDATTVIVPPVGPPLPGLTIKDVLLRHGFQDTYAFRLGGSYRFALGGRREDGESNQLILRGGLGYETATAKTGWLRADIDGAARTTLTAGAAYRARRFEISVGGGAILEGSPSNPNSGGGAQPCNPTLANQGCGGGERQGPDPVNPTSEAVDQLESPVNQGNYKAHYLMVMLGFSTWF